MLSLRCEALIFCCYNVFSKFLHFENALQKYHKDFADHQLLNNVCSCFRDLQNTASDLFRTESFSFAVSIYLYLLLGNCF